MYHRRLAVRNTFHPLVRPRCPLFRIVALLLVLLAASPFTAPFSTCDDAVLAMHDGPTADHGADKDTDSVVFWSVTSAEALTAFWSPAVARASAASLDTPGPSLFALRL